MRGGDYPLIIPTRSGYHAAQVIVHHLINKYLPERFPEKKDEFRESSPNLWVPVDISVFADTSSKVRINRNIRARDVYIISDPYSNATPLHTYDKRKRKSHTYKLTQEEIRIENGDGNKFPEYEGKISMDANFMEVLRFCEIAKNSITHKGVLNVVFPSMPYDRQDRRGGRESLDLKLAANLLRHMGVHYVLTVNVHNRAAAENAFDSPTKFDNLSGTYTEVRHIQTHKELYPLDDACFVAPDKNALDETIRFATALGLKNTPIGALLKPERDSDKPNVIGNHYGYVGNLENIVGKLCYLKDDKLDTSGTSLLGAEFLINNGAAGVIIIATHAVFSPPAIDLLDKAYEKGHLTRVLISDTIRQPQEVYDREYIDKTTMMKLLAKAIDHQHYEESISELLMG